MQAEQLLKQGDLKGALADLQDRVRKNPEDASLRIFLFQLLCVLGLWQRAVIQLKTCATLAPQAQTMAQMYRTAIMCELHREEVFKSRKSPLIFGEPEDWIASMIEALKLENDGEQTAAEELRARAFEVAPAIPGSLNGEAFSWIADADPRTGPLLEVIVNGRYFWAPFSAIRQMTLEAPSDLRDHVWIPASILWASGGDTIALIPTRYVGSASEEAPDLQLAKATSWTGDTAYGARGKGQKLFATDQGDHALLDIRTLSMAVDTAAPELQAAETGNG